MRDKTQWIWSIGHAKEKSKKYIYLFFWLRKEKLGRNHKDVYVVSEYSRQMYHRNFTVFFNKSNRKNNIKETS